VQLQTLNLAGHLEKKGERIDIQREKQKGRAWRTAGGKSTAGPQTEAARLVPGASPLLKMSRGKQALDGSALGPCLTYGEGKWKAAATKASRKAIARTLHCTATWGASGIKNQFCSVLRKGHVGTVVHWTAAEIRIFGRTL